MKRKFLTWSLTLIYLVLSSSFSSTCGDLNEVSFNRQFALKNAGVCPLNTVSPPTQLSIELNSLGLNEFELRLTNRDESDDLKFTSPVQLEARIENELVLMFSSKIQPTSVIQFTREEAQILTFDETSIPTSQAGVYVLSFQSVNTLRPVKSTEINVQVGCTDPKRQNYMECVLNCEKWGLYW